MPQFYLIYNNYNFTKLSQSLIAALMTPTPMPTTPNATSSRAPDFWLGPSGQTTREFDGTVDMRTIGALPFWRVEGKTQRVRRAAAPSAHGQDEWLMVAIQRRGTGRLRQRDEEAVLCPGDLGLYSTALPYELDFDGAFRQSVVAIPARRLRALCPGIDALTAVALSGTLPQVALLGMMTDCYFETGYAHLPARTADHAADALCHALAACAMTALGALETTRPNMGRYHLERIQRFALSRLGDSELSIAHVVEALDISAAHIHRLYAGEAQTFSAWLWDTRLQLCHLALSNPAMKGLSISQIAFKFGFSHAAHFSRVYRARYGTTPSAWRGRVRADLER